MILITFWKVTNVIHSTLCGSHLFSLMYFGERRKFLAEYYFELSTASLPPHARGNPFWLSFIIPSNFLKSYRTSKRWKKSMSVYYVYQEGRFSLSRKSLIGVPLKIQVYGRNIKSVTFSQLCGYNIWGIFLDSPLPMHFTGMAPQDRRVTLLS